MSTYISPSSWVRGWCEQYKRHQARFVNWLRDMAAKLYCAVRCYAHLPCLEALAREVAAQVTASEVPATIIDSLRDAIRLRKETHAAYCHDRGAQDDETRESNVRHAYTIQVLERILGVFDALLPRISAATKRVTPEGGPRKDAVLTNMFALLGDEMAEDVEAEDDEATSDPVEEQDHEDKHDMSPTEDEGGLLPAAEMAMPTAETEEESIPVQRFPDRRPERRNDVPPVDWPEWPWNEVYMYWPEYVHDNAVHVYLFGRDIRPVVEKAGKAAIPTGQSLEDVVGANPVVLWETAVTVEDWMQHPFFDTNIPTHYPHCLLFKEGEATTDYGENDGNTDTTSGAIASTPPGPNCIAHWTSIPNRHA